MTLARVLPERSRAGLWPLASPFAREAASAEPLAPPAWRRHDKTHLELTLSYPVAKEHDDATYEWEMYVFVPASFRLREQAYVRDNLYDDLQSRFRFGAPPMALAELAGAPMTDLETALDSGDPSAIVRELRLLATRVRATATRTAGLASPSRAATPEAALLAAEEVPRDGRAFARRFREVIGRIAESDEQVRDIARRTDEDVSRTLESLYGGLSLDFARMPGKSRFAKELADCATSEAAYRRDVGLGGYGRSRMDKRDAEHLEFRRHALKRFMSSVLWLDAEIREAGRLFRHVLYALAAGLAMAFAVVAAILHGPQVNQFTTNMVPWAIAVVVAYAGKDRIKALLQDVFTGIVAKYFPDRRWKLTVPGCDVEMARLFEESGFVPAKEVPARVTALRNRNDKHSFDSLGRDETILWHQKTLTVYGNRVRAHDPRMTQVVEIFRMDLRRWLTHTDDAKRDIIYADPVEGRVHRASAPRVYNVQVLHRLRRAGDDPPWTRSRVVVSRKGIVRVDVVS